MDGDLDIATCSTVDNALNLHFNDGTGFFGEKQKVKSGNWSAGIDAADVDGDGDIDLILGSINDKSIVIHRNLTVENQQKEKQTICMRGIVYNEETKEIIPNAQIALQDSRERPIDAGMTDEKGAYEFCPPPGKTYTIIVRTEAFPVHKEAVEMPEHDLKKDIYLAHPKGTYVYGRVSDKETGRPLSGAAIQLMGNGDEVIAKLQADQKGGYRYEMAFGFGYHISATAPDYDSLEVFFDLLESDYPRGRKVNLELTPIREPKGACLTGVVRDEQSLEPISGALLEIKDMNLDRSKKKETDEAGGFKSCLPFGSYEISATMKGYFFKVVSVEISKEDVQNGKEQEILLSPLEIGASIVLENIYYDVDKASLREESIAELERIVQIMKDNPTLVVEIAGHTDSDATETYNLRLSQNRAQSVVDYLLAAGIESDRLQSSGLWRESACSPQ